MEPNIFHFSPRGRYVKAGTTLRVFACLSSFAFFYPLKLSSSVKYENVEDFQQTHNFHCFLLSRPRLIHLFAFSKIHVNSPKYILRIPNKYKIYTDNTDIYINSICIMYIYC